MRSPPEVERERELGIVHVRRRGVSAGRMAEGIEARRPAALGLEAVLRERVDGAPARVRRRGSVKPAIARSFQPSMTSKTSGVWMPIVGCSAEGGRHAR